MEEVPEDMVELTEEWREKLVEAVAVSERYYSGEVS